MSAAVERRRHIAFCEECGAEGFVFEDDDRGWEFGVFRTDGSSFMSLCPACVKEVL